MKAVEVTASIDQNGNLILDEPIQTGFQQAKAGQTRPISELWSRIDAE